jgi:threonyl-tRNA synthetase
MTTGSHQIEITLPDGSHRRVPTGTRVADVLQSDKNASDILAAKVNGTLVDLSAMLAEDSVVEPVTFASPEGKEVYRHSSTHIMAQAVKEVFHSAQLTIGPALEESFYYDFAFERPFTPEDLHKIEACAQEIIKADRPFTRREMSREEAIKFFRGQGEQYKVEIIEGFQDQTVSLYEQGGGFVDLCRGPHLPSTGRVGALKLL